MPSWVIALIFVIVLLLASLIGYVVTTRGQLKKAKLRLEIAERLKDHPDLAKTAMKDLDDSNEDEDEDEVEAEG